MTATAINGKLSELLQRLPELDARLRGAGFSVSPDRWQSVYDLIYRLGEKRRLPQESEQLGRLIAPLFCDNKLEQQSFQDLFRHWAAGDFATGESGEEVVQHSVLARRQQQHYTKRTRIWPWFWVALLLLVCVGTLAYFATRPPERTLTSPPDAGQTLERIAAQEREFKPPPETDEPPAGLQPVPPRRPAEPVVLDAERQANLLVVQRLLTSLPLILLLVWLLNRWWRKRVVLRFHRNMRNDPLIYLKLRHNKRSLPFGWGEFQRRMKRGGTLVTRKLDIDKTIDRTIHKAGLFTPVMLTRDPQPAYLVLSNRAHRLDHTADRAQSLIERLREANVTVYRFEYRTDPRTCYSTGQSRKAYSLGQLARHYAGSRLLLIGDGEGLIDPFSGALQHWVRQFESWETRVLLTPAPQPWDAREAQIAHSGFAVAPFQVNGLEAVSEWLLKPSLGAGVWYTQEGGEPVPELFTQDEAEWRSSTPPERYDAEQACTELYGYLGQSGYRLLGACVVYPQLVWLLTLTLDQLLYPGDRGAGREQRLVRLSRLPWFTEGRMPDYLRRDLLQRIPGPVREEIKRAYRQIFARVSQSPAQQGGGLPFVARRGGYRAYIRDLVRFAPADSPMADGLFADVLLGGRKNLLDFVLPKWLARHLPGKRHWPWSVFSTTVAAAWLVGMVQALWSYYSPALERIMLQRMFTANSTVNLSIATLEETRALGDALEQALRARGFVNISREYVKTPSVQVRLDTLGRTGIIEASLTRERVRQEVAKAGKELTNLLEKLLKANRRMVRIDMEQFLDLLNVQFADNLQRRLLSALALDGVDLGDQTQVSRVMERQIDSLISELEASMITLLQEGSTAGALYQQSGYDRGERGLIQVAAKEDAPATVTEQLIAEMSQHIRSRFSPQLKRNLSAFAEPIAQAYQEALAQALEKAGEDRRNLPDAIVYLPGYEQAADEMRQRLSYLAYGQGDYQLIPEAGSLLQAGQSPLHLSINLSRPLSAGGVFRDRLRMPQSEDANDKQTEGNAADPPPQSNSPNDKQAAGTAEDLPATLNEPEMSVIPAGSFLMASPASEVGRERVEEPRHEVSIQSFAILFNPRRQASVLGTDL